LIDLLDTFLVGKQRFCDFVQDYGFQPELKNSIVFHRWLTLNRIKHPCQRLWHILIKLFPEFLLEYVISYSSYNESTPVSNHTVSQHLSCSENSLKFYVNHLYVCRKLRRIDKNGDQNLQTICADKVGSVTSGENPNSANFATRARARTHTHRHIQFSSYAVYKSVFACMCCIFLLTVVRTSEARTGYIETQGKRVV
jgi:hypothetical protein